MTLDIPHHLDSSYSGAGVYLAALASDGALHAIERFADDAATRAFAARHAGMRVVAAVGSAHQIIVTPDDAGDTRWSADQANAIWSAREILAGRR